jgi:hypothetical protein
MLGKGLILSTPKQVDLSGSTHVGRCIRGGDASLADNAHMLSAA